MIYRCCNPRRLEALREAGAANAIDFVEVRDAEEPVEDLKQRTLFVRMLRPQPITAANVVIGGGEVVPTVPVTWVEWADVIATNGVPGPGGITAAEGAALVGGITEPQDVLVVRTATRGDFSTYTLEILTPDHAAPLAGFDPLLARAEVAFKVECPSDFDCAPSADCPREPVTAPTIDYLAKDFDTFRRLMLDRLSLTTPGWTERNPADVGVALVELLAYVGDELSYRQDAVATEAYLGTARRRPSLRRHARLVDYAVHEGCNARVWVRFEVSAEDVPFPSTLQLLTRVDGLATVIAPGSPEHRRALAAGAAVFEPVDTTFAPDDVDRAPLADVLRPALHQSLNEIDLYTWGDDDCCLPIGATGATLLGHHADRLRAGNLLALAEVVGPLTGVPADADPARRCVVRLTSVADSEDPSGGLFHSPPDATSVPVTKIAWHAEDALTFPLCLSDRHHPGLAVGKALGNVVLADHGRSVPDPPDPAGTPTVALGVVPEPVLTYAASGSARHCPPAAADPDPGVGDGADGGAGGDEAAARVVPVRFRPTVPDAPLTHSPASPAVGAGGKAAGLPSARTSGATDPRRARPRITLHSERGDGGGDADWTPLPDLLSTDGNDACFVVETEEDGTARLRFGDNRHGIRPDPGTAFTARYRIGNGRAGNVGAGAIAHAVCDGGGDIVAVSNPMPARGGVDPEPAEAVRRDAPQAFTTQERAVTAADYAAVAERDARVQRAAATFRWTGSWRTVFVTADRLGGSGVDDNVGTAFEASLRAGIEPYRMAGYDLEVDQPVFVSLDVELHVCVRPGVLRGPVPDAVLDALSSTTRADGALGFFHPDHFTFGEPVYLSAIVAAAQLVEGVESVTAVRFQRQHDPAAGGPAATAALEAGVLAMGRLEIARLANDPNFPGHGLLVVTAGGGL